MRLALRLILAALLICTIVLLLLKNLITDRIDQYGVGLYIKHKVKTGFRDGTLDPMPPLPEVTGDKIIVMAKLERDDTQWVIDELSDWQSAIYTVNPSGADPSALITPKNKGREAMAYLTYIIDNYSRLPSFIAFLHSHKDGFLPSWHTDTPLHSNVDALRSLKLDYVKKNGYVNLRCKHTPGCLEKDKHNAHVTPKIYLELFSGTSTELDDISSAPQSVGTACCAQFAVTKEQVRMRPLTDYEVFRDWLLNTDESDAKSGRVMEFVWHIIFGRDAV